MRSSHSSTPAFGGLRHSLLAGIAVSLSACAVHPQPFTAAERAGAARSDRLQMIGRQEPITGPITLDEAMARAIHYNLDHRVQIMQEALAHDQLDLSNFDLLPKLTTAAGYSARNRLLASRSVGLQTGSTTLPPSYSTTPGETSRRSFTPGSHLSQWIPIEQSSTIQSA